MTNDPTVKIQWDDVDSVEKLPKDLTGADAGAAWWIDDRVHVWDGSEYLVRRMQTCGKRYLGRLIPSPIASSNLATEQQQE